ncbi:MAG: shikimate kinase, partial [Candidatus Margulisbacteria bacterium]|nr:shikimate kinase [Candidatus Margulisiibacteriota bacterium]
LAKHLSGYTFIDSDEQLEKTAARKISEIFENEGETYFRDLETEVLQKICKKSKQIVSTGGGIILRENNVRMMRENGIVFWLAAKPQTIYERIKDEAHRPLINTGEDKKQVMAKIETMLEQRFDLYNSSADVIINTEEIAVQDLVESIRDEYERLLQCKI